MRHLYLLLLSIFVAGCGSPISDAPSTSVQGETFLETTKAVSSLDLGKGVVLDDFAERQLIESPLELTGVAPRGWFFEGIVPITLLT